MDHTNSSVPAYLKIAGGIAEDIAVGRLPAGARLPSERDLAASMGVSRATARQAMQHLGRSGLLDARVGAGTFVAAGAIRQDLMILSSFTEEMERQGRATSSIIVEAVEDEPSAPARAALPLVPGGSVYRLVRVRLVESVPVAIEASEIDASRVPGLLGESDLSRRSLYAILAERHSLKPTSATQTIEAAAAGAGDAHRLRLEPGAPVLHLSRLTRDRAGVPFEYAVSVYRGDAFVMRAELTLRSLRS